ncbi:hypothetical protein N185_16985 [Sinorhizobium sp. GW3]|nr:hypothetical protein N185_16985 [Sinorhizobium sp. GW3]
MKTDDLINLLSKDTKVPARLDHVLGIAIGVGFVVSCLFFFARIGIRPDIETMIATARVFFKVAVTLALALTACALLFRIGRPGVPLKANATALLIPLLVLAVGVIVELYVVPLSSWKASMVGRYSRSCMIYIPLLSLAPLAAFLWALTFSAPERPALAGAVAGLAASGIAAALYAWHCPDDSPLFVATWYVMGIAIITLAGAAIGSRVLRW